MPLNDRCKGLAHEAKLWVEEVAQLKNDAQDFEENIVAARERNNFLIVKPGNGKEDYHVEGTVEAALMKIQSDKASVDTLQLRNKQSLESCTEAKEKQTCTLQDESEEAARWRKVQLDSYKAVCRDLKAKLAALENERKNLGAIRAWAQRTA